MPANNSLLDTNLNASPYYDDYDSSKGYYKMLFKPKSAVQIRELNQLQSMMQNQIQSFGQNIFKDGSIIKGCSFTFDNQYSFVKISDTYSNTSAITVSDFNNLFVTNQNGLKAVVINTAAGSTSNAPNLNTLYVKYMNSGTFANGVTQSQFANSDLLTVTTTANLVQGQVYAANTVNNSGYGYAMTVTDGIIFKKGYFLEVNQQTIIVDSYSNIPDGISVGFGAVESIITANSDETLYDNAAGSTNYSAPGADRLKIEPILVVRPTISSNTNSFFSLVDFKSGAPVTIKQVTQFNSIAIEEAKRTYETNGNFVVNPFVVSSLTLANTADPNYSGFFNSIVSAGIGYVNGYRVQFLNNNYQLVRRGTDTASVTSQITSINFGYYVLCDELSGQFGDSSQIIKVQLHNVPKTSVSTKSFLATGFSPSTQIGTAYIRGIAFDNGIQGTSTGTYRLYLFDIVMNPGSTFTNVQSVLYVNNSGTLLGVADVSQVYNITSNNYITNIVNPYLNTMIYNFGQDAIKPDGFNNTQFTYRNIANSQFLTSGLSSVSIQPPIGLGNENYLYTGTLSNSEMNDFIVIPTSNGYSTAKSGTVNITSSNNIVVGSGTTFINDYNPGDVILIDSILKSVTTVSNNNSLVVDSVYAITASAQTHNKAFITGNPIPFNNSIKRNMTVSANTLTINLGESVSTAFNINVSRSINRSSTTSIKKQLNSNIFVKINCSNNVNGATGPWSLGLPDVISVEGVYIDSTGNNTYSNTGINYVSQFTLDNGQRDSYYDIAKISLNNTSSNLLNGNTSILVQLSCFTFNTSQGVGFFTANSYPIDDINSSNTNAITTAEIPTYTSSAGIFYDLRNCIDFRPYPTLNANTANNISLATLNPAANLVFNYTPYLPAPDSLFQTDLQYYLARTDRLAIDTNGNLIVTEGKSGVNNPPAPVEKNGTMTLSLLSIPPYPSLTTNEAKQYNRYDLAIESSSLQNRRYTMKDIGSFDKRISNLEYYTSLSLLEQSAASLQIRSSATGQTRFQNGIFVDPFNGFDLSNTKHPKFYIAIDPDKTELRPAFIQIRSDFIFDPALSNGVTKAGDLVLLNYNANNVMIQQSYASKYRNCIDGNTYTWKGTIVLTPSGSLAPDTSVSPAVINNIDLAQNFVNLASAWGTQWNNWQTISTTYSNIPINTTTSTSQTVTPDYTQTPYVSSGSSDSQPGGGGGVGGSGGNGPGPGGPGF